MASECLWYVKPDDDAWMVYDRDGNTIGWGLTEREAHTVAAAPELLAALESVLDFANESGLPCDLEREPEFIAARALIAKAKGIAE